MGHLGDIAVIGEFEKLLNEIEKLKEISVISKDDALEMLEAYAKNVIDECETGYR